MMIGYMFDVPSILLLRSQHHLSFTGLDCQINNTSIVTQIALRDLLYYFTINSFTTVIIIQLLCGIVNDGLYYRIQRNNNHGRRRITVELYCSLASNSGEAAMIP
jgi:hypothetical protein